MIDRRIITALAPTSEELCLFVGCCFGVALAPAMEWLWIWLVLPRLI